MASTRIVSDSTVIDASPEQIFNLLADPRQHRRIDGSGMLQETLIGPDRLSLGATFGMKMKFVLPYRVTNTVVEFEENKSIAWQHLAKHTWRYELESYNGATLVTESWDWSSSPVAFPMELGKFPAKNKKAITASLARLKETIEAGQSAH